MSQEFTVQCENCGTLYPGIHDVCPYCGEPQPLPDSPYDDQPLSDEELTGEEAYDEAYDESYENEEEEFPEDTGYPHDEPYAEEDDIFAVAGEEEYHDEYYDDENDDGYDDEYDDDDYEELEEHPRRVWPRVLLGCLGMLLCVLVFYGGIGIFATYRGLQERTGEVKNQAQDHYQRGQDNLASEHIELAIAEFEEALRLNPNLLAAREALREAERIAQSRPTPTSETRSAVAAALLREAENFITQENWAEAADKLSQLKDLDPDFQTEPVSELIYQTNYQWGLQLITPNQIDQALQAFETALAERPNDSQALTQKEYASLYLDGITAVEQEDYETAITSLSQLIDNVDDYLDAQQQLAAAYIELGDEYAAEKEWCDAEIQYVQAALLQPDDRLKTKTNQSSERCKELAQVQQTPAVQATKPTATTSRTSPATGNTGESTVKATQTPTVTVAAGQGKILYSMFNAFESRWEIMSIPAGGGTPQVVVVNGTMPALSPNGKLMVYHSELIESEGFHTFDLTSGQDQRITLFTRHILPRWGGDNKQFLFVAEEPGTGRWQVHQGFADGKSDPIIIRDGRTADLSSDNSMIAYQGTDPEGNNPGIYLVPFGGGEATRLTNHESDRSPAFSPNGSQLAYMSTRNGNWDIYVVSTEGSAPRQLTTASGQDGLPIWSPDGTQIAYISDADGSWAIYTIAVNGGKPFKVTEWDGNRSDWLLSQIWWAH